jgi:hypothetical protein
MRNDTSKVIVRTTIVLLMLASSVLAETITLRDGSKITGTITSQTDTKVELKTSYGTLSIDKSNIATIDYGGSTPAPSQQPAQQPAVVSPQQQQAGGDDSRIDFDSGFRDGKAKGYDDGYQKGRSERKSAALTGSLVGWLVEVALVLVVVLASASSY